MVIDQEPSSTVIDHHHRSSIYAIMMIKMSRLIVDSCLSHCQVIHSDPLLRNFTMIGELVMVFIEASRGKEPARGREPDVTSLASCTRWAQQL